MFVLGSINTPSETVPRPSKQPRVSFQVVKIVRGGDLQADTAATHVEGLTHTSVPPRMLFSRDAPSNQPPIFSGW